MMSWLGTVWDGMITEQGCTTQVWGDSIHKTGSVRSTLILLLINMQQTVQFVILMLMVIVLLAIL